MRSEHRDRVLRRETDERSRAGAPVADRQRERLAIERQILAGALDPTRAVTLEHARRPLLKSLSSSANWLLPSQLTVLGVALRVPWCHRHPCCRLSKPVLPPGCPTKRWAIVPADVLLPAPTRQRRGGVCACGATAAPVCV